MARSRPSPSGRRGSNSRPQPWQGCALPTELRPLASGSGCPRECEENHSRCSPGSQIRGRVRRRVGASERPECSVACARGCNGRAASTTRRRPAIAVSDHGLTVGDGVFEAIKVVDGQPVRADAAPRAAGAVGARAGAAGARRGAGPRGRRGGARGPDLTPRPGPDHLHRRAGAAGLRPRATSRRRWSWSRRRWIERPRADVGGRTVPWPRNERGALAGLKTTSYAENVRRPRRTPSDAGRSGGDLRQPRRQPVRGHRARTSSTSSTASCARRRWRAAAWPA